MRAGRRVRAGLVVALLALMINLPLAFSVATERRVARDGVDVRATVVSTWVEGAGGDREFWVSFVLPEEVDPQRLESAAEVEPEVHAGAVEEGWVTVRVLPERPTAFRVDGQVTHRGGLWITVVADVLLVLLVLLLWRSGRYATRPALLRMEAVADLVPVDPEAGGCSGGSSGDDGTGRVDLPDGTCELRGRVLESSVHEVVLALPGATAIVILDGHDNPVGPGSQASARGRLLDG